MWIDSSKGIIGSDSLAILFDVLMSNNWDNGYCNAVDDHGLLKQNCPHDFVAAYANPWPSNDSRNWGSQQVVGEGPLYLQYHARSSATIETPLEGKGGDCSNGLLCERQSSVLPMLGKDFRLVERRYSISLRSHFTNFSIVALEDPVTLDSKLPPLFVPYYDGNQEPYGLEQHNIRVTSEQRGIAQFQYLIFRVTESWYYDWSATLSHIDDLITIKVSDIAGESRTTIANNFIFYKQVHDLINPNSRDNLMYDDRELQRSERYFSILQLLRLFRDDIEISAQDLVHFRNELRSHFPFSTHESKEVGHNWKVVLKRKKERYDDLLKRIERKTREIESLRDGVSYPTWR